LSVDNYCIAPAFFVLVKVPQSCPGRRPQQPTKSVDTWPVRRRT